MKAFVVDRYGKKRALRLADTPHPELRDDEVLVEVHAAGVNLLDSKIRDGEFKLILPYRLPLILGARRRWGGSQGRSAGAAVQAGR